MHIMCENNERYACKNARWIKKTMQCMWIQNTNDAWKKFGQKYKTENFPVSIDQASSEHQAKLAEVRLQKLEKFWLIE